ncbi:MAG: acyl-CoA dehydrogenase family protein, partial [Anaerolineales bacterium]|nr:acyl-CoA dehydrogenase family protein [Anaerolineales bacterium]
MMNDTQNLDEKNAATAVSLATSLAQQFATRADEADREGVLPAEDVAALKESGYLGISVPREFGGYGLTLRECVAAQLALASLPGISLPGDISATSRYYAHDIATPFFLNAEDSTITVP